MKLAFVTRCDSSDIDDWSGTTYYLKRALDDSGLQTIPISNMKEGYRYLTTGIKKALYRYLFLKEYQRFGDPSLNNILCQQVEKSLSTIECDALFVTSTIPLSYWRTEKPIVYCYDCTFAGAYEFVPAYAKWDKFLPPYTGFCAETIQNGNRMQQSLLSKCRLAIFSSEWAANTALKYYDVDPSKVKVVPFGANLECHRDVNEIKKIISYKNFDLWRLLFVGSDWFWKGGDVAVKIAESLNQQGIKTELHVVGCRPKGKMPDFVKLHGYISKKTEQGRKELDDLYSKAHFLILPTKAECCSVVLAEASSFGLPSLATDVGGNTTAIHNGRNGQTFSPDDGPGKYCQYLSGLMSNRQEYEKLALSSFQEYTERLNWKTAGQKMNDLISEFCGSK